MEDIIKIRTEFQACIRLAKETDSKKEDAALKADANKLMLKLRVQCKHEATVITAPYSPSWSSYEDPEPEMRLCLCCGLGDRELVTGAGTFLNLKAEPIGRFDYRQLWKDDVPDQLKNPLNYLFNDLIEFVENSYPKKIIRNMSTPESRAFWESCEKNAAEVATWSDSKRAF